MKRLGSGVLGSLLLATVGCAEPPANDAEAGEAAIVGDLPACANEHALMRAIHAGAKDVVKRGPIPEELFATAKNRVDPKVLVEGPEIFPKMAELIANAEREILFQTFVWEESIATKTLVDGLGRLQARLCPGAPDPAALARCVDDRAGKPPVVARFVVDASKLGIVSAKASVTMPIMARALDAQHLDPALVRWEIATFEHTTFGNNHGKTLVIDGREAIITGANPQPHHDPPDPSREPSATNGPWHDTGYHVSGEVAQALAGDFDYAWNRSMAWACGAKDDGRNCERKTAPIEHVTLPTDLPETTCAPILVIGRKRNANPFNNRTDNTQDQAFLAAFRAAQAHIHIETPNLNDDHAKKALLDAAERGVIVDIVLAKEFNEKSESLPGQGGPNGANVRKLYAELAKRGVANPCERLRIRWYSYCPREASCAADERAPVLGNGPRANHTKYATIDDTVAIVGSTNLDTQSWNNAHEVDLVIDDPKVTVGWDRQVFLRDFDNGVVVDECLGR
jgi:phosphatidylserine/phosphatidylglycerophosphate/cardiolipin synthase-like enzyme